MCNYNFNVGIIGTVISYNTRTTAFNLEYKSFDF